MNVYKVWKDGEPVAGEIYGFSENEVAAKFSATKPKEIVFMDYARWISMSEKDSEELDKFIKEKFDERMKASAIANLLDSFFDMILDDETVQLDKKDDALNSSLSFAQLRRANTLRLPFFKNKRGILAHSVTGADWSFNDWMTAVTGEVGELASMLKSLKRGDFNLMDEFTDKTGTSGTRKFFIGRELADVAIYLDLLSIRLGLNLEECIREKFNFVSEQQKIDVKL